MFKTTVPIKLHCNTSHITVIRITHYFHTKHSIFSLVITFWLKATRCLRSQFTL